RWRVTVDWALTPSGPGTHDPAVMSRTILLLAALIVWGAGQQPAPQPASPVPATHLRTRWAAQVVPDKVLPEYPRPQMVRRDWQNLNGPWSYALTGREA